MFGTSTHAMPAPAAEADVTLPGVRAAARLPLSQWRERCWKGKVWQRGKGQRARALVIAERLGHEVVIAYQEEWGTQRGYFTTSFSTWAEYDEWSATRCPDEEPCHVYEVWVRAACEAPAVFEVRE